MDPIMQPLVAQLEFPAPTEGRNPYVDLVRTIVFQQLSVKAAQTIFERFLTLFDDHWPNPQRLVQLDLELLRSVGLSRQKATYVKNVAAFFLEENLDNHNWDAQNEESVLQLLTRIKGVGRWTAEMILMFTLNRPDVFPLGDLGIQTAIIKLYGVSKEDKDWKNQMNAIANAWRPYRTYASKYLWLYLDTGVGKA
ncbi:MAG: DNA-3-methyladenine glycosylase 2 family protein [Saprospirales bacterium]|nr:DNA-3-methyladenine glycosylase 2 family protein [Saprospirales bacterium]MBK8489985.1 DNA-3-methyladenine glycosylase 2 family protein [Saprospirales bacterium]